MKKLGAMMGAAMMVVIGGLILWVAASRTGENGSSEAAGEKQPPSAAIGEFKLIDSSGKTFDSAELDGSVWVASFFFSSCPMSCTKQNELVGVLHREFRDKGIRFISISVDPETDTPERLREYATQMRAVPGEWNFLTGDMHLIRRIGMETFKLVVDVRTHADRFVTVDKWGNIRGVYNWKEDREVEALRKQLVELAAETQPPADDKDAA